MYNIVQQCCKNTNKLSIDQTFIKTFSFFSCLFHSFSLTLRPNGERDSHNLTKHKLEYIISYEINKSVYHTLHLDCCPNGDDGCWQQGRQPFGDGFKRGVWQVQERDLNR